MRGFTGTAPCWLHVSDAFEAAVGAPGPYEIDGANAERESDGLLVLVGLTRYLVPMAHVVMVTQEQEAPPQNPQVPDPGPGEPPSDDD